MSGFTDQLFHVLSRPFAGEGEKPNFLIGGAPRSGTTTLADLLGNHPDVYLCPMKEPQYFSAYFNNPDSWYMRQFTPPEGVIAVGEASTNYIYRENVPERVYRFNPDMNLIFILRDPVKRAYSHYKREIQTHGVNDDFMNLLKGSDHYIKPGLYYTHFERFRAYFPEDQIQLLIFENFINSPIQVLERVADFLGVKNRFPDMDLRKKANPSRFPRSIKLQQIIYRLFGQRDGEPIYLRYIKGGMRLVFTRMNERGERESSFPELGSREVDYLKEIYEPEVKKINQHIENNVLEFWNFE